MTFQAVEMHRASTRRDDHPALHNAGPVAGLNVVKGAWLSRRAGGRSEILSAMVIAAGDHHPHGDSCG